MTSSDTADYGFDFIALGDSFASGEGAFEYKPSTDVAGNKCHLSLASYPYSIGRSLGLESYESVACSGAEINDVFVGDFRRYRGQVDEIEYSERGAEQISGALNNFIPGYLNQSTFLDAHKPKNITVSAGGNDIDFSGIIAKCVSPGTCYPNKEDRIELAQEVQRQIPRLETMYAALLDSGHYDSSVYAIGYPQVADPNGGCRPNVMLNQDELRFASNLISYLNKSIQIAAERAGVFYVDVEDAFIGNRLCEYKIVSAMNGITAGNDRFELLGGPIGNESYHPTAYGHELYHQRIKTETSGFTVQMPQANPSAWFDDDTLELNLYENAPVSEQNRIIRKTQHDSNITDDFLIHNQDVNIQSNDSLYTLPPNEPYEVWAFSDPILLDTIFTNEQGVLDATISVPDTLPVGYHTIKILGEDVTNEPVSLYKTVFVAETLESIQPPEEEPEDLQCIDGSEPTENGMCEDVSVGTPTITPTPLPEQKPPFDNPETVAGNEEVNIPEETDTDDQAGETNTIANEESDQTPETTTPAPTVTIAQASDATNNSDPEDTGQVAGASDVKNKQTVNPVVASQVQGTASATGTPRTFLRIVALFLGGVVIAFYYRYRQHRQNR